MTSTSRLMRPNAANSSVSPSHEQQLEEVGFLLLQLHDDQAQPRSHHFDQQRDDALADGEYALSRALRVLSSSP